jgi:hypothetical protein
MSKLAVDIGGGYSHPQDYVSTKQFKESLYFFKHNCLEFFVDQRDLWDEDQGQYLSIHSEDKESAHVRNL